MNDDLIAIGLNEFAQTGTANAPAIQFDLTDPEQYVSVAFGGLALSAIKARAPLEALCDESPSGNGVHFSLSGMTGPKVPAPVAKADEKILRGVHWEIEDTSAMKGNTFSVLRFETVQQVGRVYRKTTGNGTGQVICQIEEQRRMTPDQIIADFRTVSQKLLPKKFHAKMGLVANQ